MRISTFARHVREGVKSVVRNGWMSFASISAISISLFVLGSFLMLALNVNNLASQFESQVEIRVYFKVDTPQQQMDALQRRIAEIPQVKRITFIPKEEGLKQLREMMGEEGQELLEGLEGEDNPVNDAAQVEVTDPHLVAQVAQQIQSFDQTNNPPIIEQINYGKGTVEKLFKITQIVRFVGIVFVLLLAFTSMFLISNTIKITIVARRREIGIMKLVGATNGFIRWPFFIEGALLGLIGSVIPAVVLLWGYAELYKQTQANLGLLLIRLIPVRELILILPGLLLGIGIMIGIWGSLLSVRKFLRV
jgi:cell division transport system permease protein